MQKILSNVFDNQFTADEYFALSLAGWVFPIFAWAGTYFLINILCSKIIADVVSILIFVIPFFFIKVKKISYIVLYLFLFLVISLLLRLAFLEQAIFPAYFDSAQHYLNIQNLLNMYEDKPFSLFQPNYYHLGYHFLSATLIYIFQFNEINFMLVFGQITLAVLPISFFFLLKQITQSNAVAFFTCLIAAFGFHMPAHLVNWGKYPALLSLIGIQFVFCLGYVAVKNHLIQNQKLKTYSLIVFSIVITTLIHSRAIIVFTLLIIAYFFILQFQKISSRFHFPLFILLLIIFGIEIFYVQQSPVLFPLLQRYLQKDIWILTLVLFLTSISIKTYPNLTFFLFTSVCLFIFPLFLPISLLNYGTQTLLDRPFVQMLAYIPLSILAGLGFTGLLKMTQKFSPVKYALSFILFGFVILNANFNYDFYPSPCCQLVNRDDLSAIAWIEKNVPAHEKILIAATQLYVTAYEPPSPAAVDAGVWIQPLTSRETLLIFITANFETIETHTYICNQKIKYIYIGSMPQSFNQTQLASQPSWYQPVFLLPHAQVYQIIGCE